MAILSELLSTTYKGPAGPYADITVGTVTTGAVGSNASITSTPTPAGAELSFTIPRGDKGETGPAYVEQIPFSQFGKAISSDYTVGTTYNEMSIGPLTINDGVTVTIADGAEWVIL